MSSLGGKHALLNKHYKRFKRSTTICPDSESSVPSSIAGPSNSNSLEAEACQSSRSSEESDFEPQEFNLDLGNDQLSNLYSELRESSYPRESHGARDPQNSRNVFLSDTSPHTFSNGLANWAVKFNIAHNALGELLNLLIRHDIQVPQDPRTLLKTPRNTGTSLKIINPGSYIHFGFQKALQKLVNQMEQKNIVCESNNLMVCVNIDGLPVSKSSGSQLWPIMINLFNNKSYIEIVGIYHGNEKPKSSNNYLEEFVTEATAIIPHGIFYFNRHYNIKLVFVCDVPAKSFIKCTRGHSGYMSCSKCNTEGIFRNNRICFPQITNFQLRTDLNFRTKEQESHHTNTSILENLPGLNMIDDFPLDYMHLVCLGVVKKLIVNLWISGHPPYKWSSRQLENISSLHTSLQKCTPLEFSRKPRSLSEAKRWKATEFRMFLFYTGPVVLKNNVSEEVYLNFICLHVALNLLSKCLDVDYARELLSYFVKTFIVLYGSENVSHNIHNLLHLADDVTRFGSIENFSAFPFENNMLFLKKKP